MTQLTNCESSGAFHPQAFHRNQRTAAAKLAAQTVGPGWCAAPAKTGCQTPSMAGDAGRPPGWPSSDQGGLREGPPSIRAATEGLACGEPPACSHVSSSRGRQGRQQGDVGDAARREQGVANEKQQGWRGTDPCPTQIGPARGPRWPTHRCAPGNPINTNISAMKLDQRRRSKVCQTGAPRPAAGRERARS